MLPGGDQIVSGAFRGGSGQDRSGDLEEPVLRHGLSERRNDVAAQDYVLLDVGVPQVKEPVFEPLGLVSVAAVVNLEGETVVNALSFLMWLYVALTGAGVYSTALMWFVYLFLGIYFYFEWRKELKPE